MHSNVAAPKCSTDSSCAASSRYNLSMPQQQAHSPVALAQRYADLVTPSRAAHVLLSASVGLIVVLLAWIVFGPVQPLPVFALLFLVTCWVPMLVTQSNSRRKESVEVYSELLAVVKDDTLPMALVDRVTLLIVLPRSTPLPLPALAQARLAQKLAYANPTELAELPRAPLHAWLRDLETPDDLRISLLLALGSLHDHAIRPLAQEIAQIAPTERLREAALECLKSLESVP